MKNYAYGMRNEGITPDGLCSRATGFTSTGKVRITKNTYGSPWTPSRQKAAYQAAMATDQWDFYLTPEERTYRSRQSKTRSDLRSYYAGVA